MNFTTRVAPSPRTPAQMHGKAEVSLLWVEVIKAIALLWIFWNHVIERLFGYPHFGNPTSDWAPFDVRLAQLRPLEGYGVWDIPMSLLRYLGWSGDQGVQLFLIISGFGLTWGLLSRGQTGQLQLVPFYLRRAARIYPTWWGAHVLFIGTGMSFANGSFIASLLGFRATPQLMYLYEPAWWYVGLLLQLYLVYPMLWKGLYRWGPWHLLLSICAAAFIIRGAGLLWFSGYLDAWSRGAVFITRLPEFGAGICLAAWLHAAPEKTDDLLRSRRVLACAVVAYFVGTGLSLTLVGMTVAPFLVGVAAFVLLYAAVPRHAHPHQAVATTALEWIGRKSYSLFLVHGPIVRMCLPPSASGVRAIGGVVAAAALSVIVALALEWAVGLVTRQVSAWWQRGLLPGVAWRLALTASVLVAVLVAAEFTVRRFDPQEVAGWGERPSLEPHPDFGWRLRPSTQTRLRWEGYDYTVDANSLGFPGPEYAAAKPPGTLRIFTVGDAYTSAEGVDTPFAWPRLLEDRLRIALPTQPVQVMNFAITGYGPEQTAAVLREFVPRYRPDVIIYGFFVNEYLDVLMSNRQFQGLIGFGQPESGVWAFLHLPHLRKYLRSRIRDPLVELARETPNPHGYFLGNFSALEKGNHELLTTGHERVFHWLEQIRAVSSATGAKVLIAMIPAPVQVCGPGELGYYPRHVDLGDRERFDLEQPQRLTLTIAEQLGFEVLDVRAALRTTPEGCPFRGDNMHFTEAGQRRLADAVAARLLADRQRQ